MFVCYRICEDDNSLRTNEPIVMPISTNGPRGKNTKRSTLGSGQRSTSDELAKDKFGGLARHHSLDLLPSSCFPRYFGIMIISSLCCTP